MRPPCSPCVRHPALLTDRPRSQEPAPTVPWATDAQMPPPGGPQTEFPPPRPLLPPGEHSNTTGSPSSTEKARPHRDPSAQLRPLGAPH